MNTRMNTPCEREATTFYVTQKGGQVWLCTLCGDAYIGACERYADRLKKESYERQYYMELRRGGLEHRQALRVSRGREMV